MINRSILSYIILSLILVLASCSTSDDKQTPVQLTISAAISFSDVLNELKELYEQENNEIEIVYNFGGSGTLAQQIQQGAPVDIFISANEQWIETLQDDSLINDATLTTVATNELVLIGQQSQKSEPVIEDYLNKDAQTIAIGHPDTVPAGKYASQVLDTLDLYDRLKEQIIFAKDVRQVLTYVETGNADYGFVYKSDTTTAKNSDVLMAIDSTLHDQIAYPAAIISNTNHEQDAQDFLNFLMSDIATEIYQTYGFSKP